ncbi:MULTISPECIES: hypothetical protein [Chromobacterium]|uniref:hypothetical protein n=1 Tax=Chromobacterium TaxID=535 RepID=UPI0009DA3F71|nr:MULTISPECIES: hypothetical protein [Chromobacterium]OQS41503.1 hypothetical protein B0T39_08670 [Chromobacterium haemolyticum]UJB29906.1 hypothetical protein HQN78_01795 [Chromobacterium sp. Beijing]
MSYLRAASLLPALLLLSECCLADVGSMGENMLNMALFAIAFWLALTCLVFWKLRRHTAGAQFGFTLLFLLLPLLWVVSMGR